MQLTDAAARRRAPLTRTRQRRASQHGYAMAALLVAMSVMAVLMTVAVPVWKTAMQREREAELVFRGEQYARAIALFQRKYANALPPTTDVLINEKFLRKKYKDPITGGEFQLLSAASLQAATGVRGGQQAGARGGTGSGSGTPGRATGGGTGSGTGSTFSSGSSSFGSGSGSSFGSGTGSTIGSGIARGIGGVPGGIMGVTSSSSEKSFRLYNGRGAYNEWTFVATQRTLNAGAGGEESSAPGMGRNGRGRGAQQPGGGRGSATPRGIGSGNRPGASGFGSSGSGFGRP
jgi:type II secretory pathway pseudopilin PulG